MKERREITRREKGAEKKKEEGEVEAEREEEEEGGGSRRKRRKDFLVCNMILVWRLCFVLVRVLCFAFSCVCFSCRFVCVCRGGALLYESPGGNQVDGLPPAFNTGA